MAPKNLGIIQYVTGGNAASYHDGKGVTRAAATNLSNGTWRRSNVVQVGRGERLAITITGALGVAQSVKIRLLCRNEDPTNGLVSVSSGVTWPWCPVAAARADGTAVAAAENAVVVADLTGIDGGVAGVMLLTENTGPSGDFSVIVETANAADVADVVIVAAMVM